MREILRPLCIPEPTGRLAYLLSRSRLEWNYKKYVFRAHDNILTARHRMPRDKFDAYFKFAFVRNPWERLVSEYEFLLTRPQHGRYKRVKNLENFQAFIHMQIPRYDAYQLNMLCDKNGDLLMDYVGKMEHLQSDWETACNKGGIPFQALPHKNPTPRRHYQEYYDKDSIQLVATQWAREIEQFEYTYDD